MKSVIRVGNIIADMGLQPLGQNFKDRFTSLQQGAAYGKDAAGATKRTDNSGS